MSADCPSELCAARFWGRYLFDCPVQLTKEAGSGAGDTPPNDPGTRVKAGYDCRVTVRQVKSEHLECVGASEGVKDAVYVRDCAKTYRGWSDNRCLTCQGIDLV